MMEGFEFHTFRFINAHGVALRQSSTGSPAGASTGLGQAQKIAGKDPDFHRRVCGGSVDGATSGWELGLQLIEREQGTNLGFDLLDPTKLIPGTWYRCSWSEGWP
jgi:catalase